MSRMNTFHKRTVCSGEAIPIEDGEKVVAYNPDGDELNVWIREPWNIEEADQ